jgi:hypothetical protein
MFVKELIDQFISKTAHTAWAQQTAKGRIVRMITISIRVSHPEQHKETEGMTQGDSRGLDSGLQSC